MGPSGFRLSPGAGSGGEKAHPKGEGSDGKRGPFFVRLSSASAWAREQEGERFNIKYSKGISGGRQGERRSSTQT